VVLLRDNSRSRVSSPNYELSLSARLISSGVLAKIQPWQSQTLMMKMTTVDDPGLSLTGKTVGTTITMKDLVQSIPK